MWSQWYQNKNRTWQRLLNFNWLVIAGMAVILLLGLAATDFHLSARGAVLSFGAAALYAGAAYRNLLTPRLRDPLVVFVLGSTAQLLLIVALMAPQTAHLGSTGRVITRLLSSARGFGAIYGSDMR